MEIFEYNERYIIMKFLNLITREVQFQYSNWTKFKGSNVFNDEETSTFPEWDVDTAFFWHWTCPWDSPNEIWIVYKKDT